MGYFELFIVGLTAYLIAAVPFGLVLTKIFLRMDVREIGSHNTGATNVLRTGSRSLALATLVLDLVKPIVAWLAVEAVIRWLYGGMVVDLARAMGAYPDADIKIFVSIIAVLAHCFPVYLKFKGGKGVATACGTMFLFSPYMAVVAFGSWLAILFIAKKSSLASLAACVLTPLYAWLLVGEPRVVLTYVAIALFVVARHRANIRRLIKGEEDSVRVRRDK